MNIKSKDAGATATSIRVLTYILLVSLIVGPTVHYGIAVHMSGPVPPQHNDLLARALYFAIIFGWAMTSYSLVGLSMIWLRTHAGLIALLLVSVGLTCGNVIMYQHNNGDWYVIGAPLILLIAALPGVALAWFLDLMARP